MKFQLLEAEHGIGFNRYIVECKCSLNYRRTQNTFSFNRYIVECKFTLQVGSTHQAAVLIDT